MHPPSLSLHARGAARAPCVASWCMWSVRAEHARGACWRSGGPCVAWLTYSGGASPYLCALLLTLHGERSSVPCGHEPCAECLHMALQPASLLLLLSATMLSATMRPAGHGQHTAYVMIMTIKCIRPYLWLGTHTHTHTHTQMTNQFESHPSNRGPDLP